MHAKFLGAQIWRNRRYRSQSDKKGRQFAYEDLCSNREDVRGRCLWSSAEEAGADWLRCELRPLRGQQPVCIFWSASEH